MNKSSRVSLKARPSSLAGLHRGRNKKKKSNINLTLAFLARARNASYFCSHALNILYIIYLKRTAFLQGRSATRFYIYIYIYIYIKTQLAVKYNIFNSRPSPCSPVPHYIYVGGQERNNFFSNCKQKKKSSSPLLFTHLGLASRDRD